MNSLLVIALCDYRNSILFSGNGVNIWIKVQDSSRTLQTHRISTSSVDMLQLKKRFPSLSSLGVSSLMPLWLQSNYAKQFDRGEYKSQDDCSSIWLQLANKFLQQRLHSHHKVTASNIPRLLNRESPLRIFLASHLNSVLAKARPGHTHSLSPHSGNCFCILPSNSDNRKFATDWPTYRRGCLYIQNTGSEYCLDYNILQSSIATSKLVTKPIRGTHHTK